MQYTSKEQAAALSGIFQAAGLVEQMAKNGQTDNDQLEPLIQSLFITNPDNVSDVYGGYENLMAGRRVLKNVLERQADTIQGDAVRYALTLIHLERKLSRNKNMLAEIGQRLERTKGQSEHFGLMHETVISSLASIYLDTVSTFKTRVQVTGDLKNLQIPANANKIRAILFAGIRSAILWRQTGGSRFQLLIGRNKLLDGLSKL
ncbi:lysogenization regulator HflD [Endozoicomonas sp. OPT23]|uniref:high frequency lysogenization protein HflD n=1 Tax=Endozoicomonas sp. OPT23 TaxID=2072845 RepID=UPI001E1A02B9|nr:lysogenization regulator HflD [Endozoicomonas sp. OPT23]